MTATALRPVLLLTGVVQQVERLSPSFVRLTLGGAGFEDIGPDGPTLDQRVKLVLPGPGRPLPTELIDADNWYAAWLALPELDRGFVRTYTARAIVGEGDRRRLVIDFVLHGVDEHGQLGPAASWAADAQPGDEILVLAPRRGLEESFGGIEFIPGEARRLLFVADETAVPALASILESLPDDTTGVAVIEVPDATDFLDVRVPAGIEAHWIARGRRARGEQTLALLRECLRLDTDGRAVVPSLGRGDLDDDVWETPVYSSSGDDVTAAADDRRALGPDDTYAWVAGDSDTVKACRRLLVGEGGMPRAQVAFMGYWKQGRAS